MDEVKPLASRWVTADSLISPEPCLLWGVVLTASAVGVGDVTMRDGHNTGGDILITLNAPLSTTWYAIFPRPIKATKGLFCDIGSNVTGVLVLWDPLN